MCLKGSSKFDCVVFLLQLPSHRPIQVCFYVGWAALDLRWVERVRPSIPLSQLFLHTHTHSVTSVCVRAHYCASRMQRWTTKRRSLCVRGREMRGAHRDFLQWSWNEGTLHSQYKLCCIRNPLLTLSVQAWCFEYMEYVHLASSVECVVNANIS